MHAEAVSWIGALVAHRRARLTASLVLAVVVFAGCSTSADVARTSASGYPARSQSGWLLVQNPRFGKAPSEPEYIWVEDDKVPTTAKTLFFGTKSIVASADVVAKYGPPPGGGQISLHQGIGYARGVTSPARAPHAAVAPPTPTTAISVAPVVDSDATTALTALHALKTGLLTQSITYRDYEQRVIETRTKVEPFLQDPASGETPLKTLMNEAMSMYTLAAEAWNTRLRKAGYESLATNQAADLCPALQTEMRTAREKGLLKATPHSTGIGVAAGVPQILSCAAEKVEEATRLVSVATVSQNTPARVVHSPPLESATAKSINTQASEVPAGPVAAAPQGAPADSATAMPPLLSKLSPAGSGNQPVSEERSSSTSSDPRSGVVELQTGQRVEGVITRMTESVVTLEIEGQPISFPRDKVRGIYFGRAPRFSASVRPGASANDPAREALDALRAVQSVTGAGVDYAAYSSRVLDAKVTVDRYARDAQPSRARDVMAGAMRYYVLAATAWNGKIAGGSESFIEVANDPLISQCEPVQSVIRSRPDATKDTLFAPGYRVGSTIAFFGGIPALWRCASQQIAEAERIVDGRK